MNHPTTSEKNSQQFGERWGKWVVRYRWPVLIFSIALAMVFGSGGAKLGFDGDYRVFFTKDNPQLLAYEALQRKYTQDDNVLIVIAPQDGEVFNNQTLEVIPQIRIRNRQTERYQFRVFQIDFRS